MPFTRDYTWETDRTNGVPITASRMDTEFDSAYSNDNYLLGLLSTATASLNSLAVAGNLTVGTGTSNLLTLRGASIALASGTSSIAGQALFTSIVTFATNVNFQTQITASNASFNGNVLINGNLTVGDGTADGLTINAGVITLITGTAATFDGSVSLAGNVTLGTNSANSVTLNSKTINLAAGQLFVGSPTFDGNVTLGTGTANTVSLAAGRVILSTGQVFSGTAQFANAITFNEAGTFNASVAVSGTAALSSNTTVGGSLAVTVGKQTIAIPASAMKSATTNGPSQTATEEATNKNMVVTLDFDTTTQEFAHFSVPMPKSYNNGTVSFEPLWTASTGSGSVVWALEGVAVSDNESLDAAYGSSGTSVDTFISANILHVGPESGAITVAGTPATGDALLFRVKRVPGHASDTHTQDAQLVGIRLFYSTQAQTDA